MLLTFLKTALMMLIAEMGDKTQFVVMGFASRYKTKDIIAGVIGATLLLNLIGVLFGSLLSSLIDLRYVKIAAGYAFLIFAIVSILKPKKKKKKPEERQFFPGLIALSIGVTFFFAEIGDKTQLTVVTLSAQNPEQIVAVFLGATLGLVVADLMGIPIMKLLTKKLPEQIIKFLPYTLFSIFGFVTLFFALQNTGLSNGFVLTILGATAIAFGMISTLIIENNARRF